MSKSLMQAISEISAKGFVDGLTKRQFIKAAVLELKARAAESHKNST